MVHPKFKADSFIPQLMESGPIGGIGSYAVSRALEERRTDSELAPIHRHDLEAGTAAE